MILNKLQIFKREIYGRVKSNDSIQLSKRVLNYGFLQFELFGIENSEKNR